MSCGLDKPAGAPRPPPRPAASKPPNLRACAVAAFSLPRGGVEGLRGCLLERTRASHPQGWDPVPHAAHDSRLGTHSCDVLAVTAPPGKRKVGPKLDTFEASLCLKLRAWPWHPFAQHEPKGMREMPFRKGGGTLKRPALTQGCGAAGTTSELTAATRWRPLPHGGPDPLEAPSPPCLLCLGSHPSCSLSS